MLTGINSFLKSLKICIGNCVNEHYTLRQVKHHVISDVFWSLLVFMIGNTLFIHFSAVSGCRAVHLRSPCYLTSSTFFGVLSFRKLNRFVVSSRCANLAFANSRCSCSVRKVRFIKLLGVQRLSVLVSFLVACFTWEKTDLGEILIIYDLKLSYHPLFFCNSTC